MKILVVDKDALSTQLVRSKLEPLGHKVFEESAKNNTLDRLASEEFDVILIDPSPLTTPRPLVLNIRRNITNYPYIFLMSPDATREDAIKAGTNDVLSKPLDPTQLSEKLSNAERLIKMVKYIGDDSEDFPSAGGVIAKSAFNQLFLSAIDRADRYGERTFILFITLNNYSEILAMDGPYAADYAVAKLSQHLVLLRRQSDIIGQTRKNEYALILQRPVYDTEPNEAANRFIEELAAFKDITSSGAMSVEIKITLAEIPVGVKVMEQVIKHDAKNA